MRNYITRVQLRHAESTDFEKLDREMEKEAFFPAKNKKATGKELTLRSNEYNYQGKNSLQEVTAAVYRAAKSTGKEYTFTVIKDKTPFPG